MTNGEKPKQQQPLLTQFSPIDYLSVLEEVDTFRAICAEMQEQWEKEAAMYEETIEIIVGDDMKPTTLPRRNYANAERKIQDASLFPYHESCYPLLDAYNGIFSDGDSHSSLYIQDPDTGEVSANTTIFGQHFSDYLPCSPEAVVTVLSAWNSSEPLPRSQMTELILKLFRHSMSDLQRDHSLAASLLNQISSWKLCDDLSVFRRVLAIFKEEMIPCDSYCYQRNLDEGVDFPTHDCSVWSDKVLPSMCRLLSQGLTKFTEDHACVVSALVQIYFDNADPASASLEAEQIHEVLGSSIPLPVSLKQKTLLKRNLLLWRNTGEEEESDDEDSVEQLPRLLENTFPYRVLAAIVSGLESHAEVVRTRIVKLRNKLKAEAQLDQSDSSKYRHLLERLRSSIDSFYNCVRALVNIGELAVRRFPVNDESEKFCGHLVAALTQPYLGSASRARAPWMDSKRDLLRPTRYSEAITDATSRVEKLNHDRSHCGQGSAAKVILDADILLCSKPHSDVLDVIRFLFVRDIVDTSTSALGYGDILVLFKLPLSPLDPALFFHAYNIPGMGDDEDLSDRVTAVKDEDQVSLTEMQLATRYDFTLLLLVKAWRAPWAPESHHSFQKPFRDAIKCLFLCAHRTGMPLVIARNVSQFLGRDWWGDDRTECWCTMCLEEHASETVHDKVLKRIESRCHLPARSVARPKSMPVSICCPTCNVAWYCSKEHQMHDYRELHKQWCGKIPFIKTPAPEETALCREVLNVMPDTMGLNNSLASLVSAVDISDADDQDDDDSCWESIDTEEEELEGSQITQIVYKYLKKNYDTGSDEDDDDLFFD